MRAASRLAFAAIVVATLPAVTHADDRLEALGLRIEYHAAKPAPLTPEVDRPDDALPDGLPAFGTSDIAKVWLIAPTTRYGHGVLGDAIEAGGLRAILRNGETTEYRLNEHSVFEDLRPRVADLDGDGREEIIVVRSYLNAGAALAVFGVRKGRLELLAETSPIGQAHRWLNPVGVGDFDGDGRQEVAYVETPHIGGILRIVALKDGRLKEVAVRHGFSNHEIGSRALGLSAILDFDGDGRDDILIPAQGRRQLRIVTFADVGIRELSGIDAKEPVQGDFYVSDWDGYGHDDVVVPLRPGLVMLLAR